MFLLGKVRTGGGCIILLHPGSLKNYPGPLKNYPGPLKYYPGSLKNYPGSLKSHVSNHVSRQVCLLVPFSFGHAK